MRGITQQVSAGLCEGSGGGHSEGWRGRGVSGHGRGRDMPRQGVRVSACAIPLNNTAHAARRAWQREHGQVVTLSGQWSRCVRATAEVYPSLEARCPG
eukprot:5111225-Pleurochrysis_carterae.AAC.2